MALRVSLGGTTISMDNYLEGCQGLAEDVRTLQTAAQKARNDEILREHAEWKRDQWRRPRDPKTGRFASEAVGHQYSLAV